MNLDYISDHRVVDRYILGQLSEQEQVEFELYYMEHPEILDEVEVVRSLKRGLTGQQAALGATVATIPTAGKSSLLEILGRWFQSPAVLAGNFAVMATLLVLVLQPGQAPPPSAYSADRIWIGQPRGDDYPLIIKTRSGSLVLDIDVDGSGPYQVSLLDAQGRRVRNVEQVAAAEDALLVVMSTVGISSGRYTLRVTGPQDALVIRRELQLIVSN